MYEWQFTKNIKNMDGLRESFNQLSTKTFGINFEDWYENGYWTEKYEPFTFMDGDKIIANASVNKLNIIVNGEIKKAVQIGTVMTHPEYRNKGLSARLMNKVLEEYEKTVDIIYLFANRSVLEFYPKFGFIPIDECQFFTDFTYVKGHSDGVRQLDGTNQKDLQFIYKFALERLPVSTKFGITNTQELLMFYCMYVFTQNIVYLEHENVIIIYKHEEEQLHIFDVISKAKIRMEDILRKIGRPETGKVVFHFTPNDQEMDMKSTIFNGSEVLFVKTKGDFSVPDSFKHPLTSQA
jgi:GNAT superfamily N-acetyltransferase